MNDVTRYKLRTSLVIIIITIIGVMFFLNSRVADAEEARFVKQSFPGGFSLQEPVTFYSPGDLFEYINGQAVFYLSYGFKRLEHGFYEKGEATYYVDVYELDNRLSAFGAFRQQREADAKALEFGSESAVTDYLTVFYKENFYVEIIPMSSGNNDIESMKLLAGHVEKLIPGVTKIPQEVGLFPEDGLIAGSGRYVDENLISYSFMGRGLVARYFTGESEEGVRAFISLADTDIKAKQIFTEYSNKLQNPETVKIGALQGIKGKEPYRGITIIAAWQGYVFGCLNSENDSRAVELLNKLYINLNSFHDKSEK